MSDRSRKSCLKKSLTTRKTVNWFVSAAAPLDVAAARTAFFTYLLARGAGASVGLRCADNPRAAAGELDALVRDFAWLGIVLEAEPLRTAARDAVYREYAHQLVEAGRARRTDGATRLVVAAGETVVDDAVRGRIAFDNHALGEIVVATDAVDDGFAAAIDDALLGTPVIVRDDRQLEQTARGLLIVAALGLTPPRYAHVGALVPDASGAALPLVADLRRAGYLPGAVIDHLALLGWTPPGGDESLALPGLVAAFSLDRISHAPAHFNAPRLRALNARALRALSGGQLAGLLAQSMQRAGLLEDPIPDAARRWIATFLEAYGGGLETLGDALAIVTDLRAEAVVVPALELEKLRNRQVVFYLDAIGQYVDAQPELRELPLDHDVPAIAREFGIAPDDAFAALRMALTGKHDGPPLHLLFPLLGHDRILIRIGAISSHLLHGRGLEPIPFGPGGVPFQTILPTGPPPD